MWPGLAAVLCGILVLTGCGGSSQDSAATSSTPSRQARVDTDKFERLSLECQLLTITEIAKAVGASIKDNEFSGPICRWEASGDVWVSFHWFEWNTIRREKSVAASLGYATEIIKIGSATGFTQTKADRPGTCGVTAKSPGRGIYTWFVNRPAAVEDPCAAPKKLMELSLEMSA
ncbi:hypothetical protein GOEFS_132_00340 [Gordonia effusa NBRC 100432]|uniref:DUF3558 domain-containing protein n=1 Tax=Gordonia effusa NBRC 100432 TaxID=1077974 RepID=H0R6V2_9ACTN|nr:DUF3558 domain-containing protein [Gordonia effusa]GAB20803.1 hypothetical protein GOEFS_132_00340 [Gordonia effusa NBRC 100432]